MGFTITPIAHRDSKWRVNWIQLAIWILFINICLTLWVNYMIGPTKHPVSVTGKNVPVYSMATDTARASHVIGTVNEGSTVDLAGIQADGWCQVSLPEAGFPRLNGYIQQQFLLISDSTRKALRTKQKI
ncbi:SH3 domain-containing protein [Hymenobacter tenuis]